MQASEQPSPLEHVLQALGYRVKDRRGTLLEPDSLDTGNLAGGVDPAGKPRCRQSVGPRQGVRRIYPDRAELLGERVLRRGIAEPAGSARIQARAFLDEPSGGD
jgi:hypothetical protein